MANLPQEVLPQEVSKTPSAPRPPRHSIDPGFVALGGALFGIEFGWPGAIIGGVVGYVVGKKAADGNKESGGGG